MWIHSGFMGYDMLSKTKIQKLRIGSKVCEGDGLYFKKTKADGGQWSYRYTNWFLGYNYGRKISFTD